MTQATRPRRTPSRRGFTLVELLVVIAIIAILMSLGAAAIFKTRDMQMRRNSESLIIKVNDAFQAQWLRVVETAKNEQPSPFETQLAGGDDRRARVIHIKLVLKREFPMSIAEARAPAPLGPNPSYVRALQGARPGHHEAAACLYLTLKHSRRGGDFDPDTSLSSLEVTDPVGDGIKELTDGWGRPLMFIRFPTEPPALVGLLNPPGAPPDPVDPERLLADPAWVNSPAAVEFQRYLHPVRANVSYNLTPVIFSMGSNGRPFDTDDLYNFQLSPLGGKKR